MGIRALSQEVTYGDDTVPKYTTNQNMRFHSEKNSKANSLAWLTLDLPLPAPPQWRFQLYH
jgi:hypothetical protein